MGFGRVVGKAVYLGVAFLLLYTPFLTVQSLLTTRYGAQGYYVYAAMYLPYALSSALAPWIGQYLGVKVCFLVGASAYFAWLLAVNLAEWSFWVALFGAVLNGLGAGFLWVYQGVYINNLFTLLTDRRRQSGIITAVFYALYHLNLLLGSALAVALLQGGLSYEVTLGVFTLTGGLGWCFFWGMPSPETDAAWRGGCWMLNDTLLVTLHEKPPGRIVRQLSGRFLDFEETPSDQESDADFPLLLPLEEPPHQPLSLSIDESVEGAAENRPLLAEEGALVIEGMTGIYAPEIQLAKWDTDLETAPFPVETVERPRRVRQVQFQECVTVIAIPDREELAAMMAEAVVGMTLREYFATLRHLVIQKGLWLLLPKVLVISFLMVFNYAVMPAAYGRGNLQHTAEFLFLYGVAASISAIIWSRCHTYWSVKILNIWTHSLIIAQTVWAMVLFMMMVSPYWFLGVAILGGFSENAVVSTLNVTISRRFKGGEVAAAYALYRTLYCLGVVLAATLNLAIASDFISAGIVGGLSLIAGVAYGGYLYLLALSPSSLTARASSENG